MLTPRLDILPSSQRLLWPRLIEIPEHFVLYGGTAVALRLGHRPSVDFDFFSDVEFDDLQKQQMLSQIRGFGGCSILQNDKNTLTVSVKVGENPVKLSFFGGIRNGRVGEPDQSDDGVVWIASLDDLLAHKLKVIHDRAEGRDYQDIAAMLEQGQNLARGLSAREALFGSDVPRMVTLKALTYFSDVNEPWRLTAEIKSTITTAIKQLPLKGDAVTVVSSTLRSPRTA